MSALQDSTTSRGKRWGFVAGAVVVTVAVAVTPAAGAGTQAVPAGSAASPAGSTAGPGGSISGDRAEASMLAAQISAQGQRINQLAEQADAAQIRSQQLAGQLKTARRQEAKLARQLAVAHRHLRTDAVDAYVNNDIPLYGQRSGQAGQDPSMTNGYAQVVSSETRQTIQQFVTLSHREAVAERRLARAKAASDTSLTELRADQQAAQAASEVEQRTLDGVNAQLRSLVAAAEAAQARAMAAQVEARLARQHQLPPSSPVVTAKSLPAASVRAARTVVRPTTDVSTTLPATTAPPATAPPTTAPPTTTSPPTTHPPTTVAPTTTPPETSPPTTDPPTTAAPPPPTAPPPPPTTLPPPPPTAPPPPPTTAPPPPPPPAPSPAPTVGGQAPGASIALAYAYAQLGKPYQWGGAGPDSFDCSGLVMMAWAQAGVFFPHLAQDQYDMTERISLSELLPGDLVFFGTPDDVTHVGIYIGGDEMIDAPHTGAFVRIESIFWSDLIGAGRVV